MDVGTFDSEFNDSEYYSKNEQINNCYGCYLLSKGEGGENQLAHMDFGGCLYDDYSQNDEYIESNTKLTKAIDNDKDSTKCCIICNEKIENNSEVLYCVACESKEDRQRFIRYQNFIADSYLTQ